MKTDKNFLGMPVSGDITEGSTRVDQKPIEELAPLFQALVDDPTIVEFGWTQYTPYFNDGDTCDFSVNALWAMTTEDVEWFESGDFDRYYLELDYEHRSLGKIEKEWDSESRKYVNHRYEGPDEGRYDRCQALDRALQSGAFETVLLDTFGDHAMVTVRKTGIEVEHYSHD
ncbi:hypothetical protein ABZ154_09225 [Streptomyces sp. NPDC006261]|uniref:hypothetical protein n=1 Tax=Streptomyces sp. NPDC006261 TaxID=3156739 RepID=UPI0033AA2AA7